MGLDVVAVGMAKAAAKLYTDRHADVGVSNTLALLATGNNVKFTFIGDSGLEGTTATTPGTDDAASLICSTLATRFGVTVTKSNRAVSGYSSAWAMVNPVGLDSAFTLALADAADCYVISFAWNDIRSILATPGTGYPLAASMAAIEHMIRRIRIDRPFADIILSSEWPANTAVQSSAAALATYHKALRVLASRYGCLWVDAHQAFLDDGRSLDGVLVDGTAHPTSAGHAVWANAVLANFPTGFAGTRHPRTVPENSAYGTERYDGRRWSKYDTNVRAYGTNGFTTAGTWGGTAGAYTSSTAASTVTANFIGTEAFLRLDAGVGQGVVNIQVDADVWVTNFDLSAQTSGQRRFPVTGLAPGPHSILITLVSGSITFRGLDVLEAPVEWIDSNSTRVTKTGTWSTASSIITSFTGVYAGTSTIGDWFELDFVGTGIILHFSRYSAVGTRLQVSIDGGGNTNVGVANTGTNGGWGSSVLASGLAYGPHKIRVTRDAAGPGVFQWGTIGIIDGGRHTRPYEASGIAKVGETVRFPTPFSGPPVLTLTPRDATSAIPPYPTVQTTTGFLVNGTAGALVQWTAKGNRVAY